MIDPQSVVRAGIRAVLSVEPDIDIVAEGGEAGEVVQLVRNHRPDVVLLDLVLRGGSGLDEIAIVRRSDPNVRIVVLTNHDDEEHVVRAVFAGVHGYVLKTCHVRQIVDTLRAVHAGRRYIAPEVSYRLVERAHSSPLTVREHEVLVLMARGAMNREIADALGITSETVKTHVKSILAKLRARSRTEAAGEAIRRGIIDMD